MSSKEADLSLSRVTASFYLVDKVPLFLKIAKQLDLWAAKGAPGEFSFFSSAL